MAGPAEVDGSIEGRPVLAQLVPPGVVVSEEFGTDEEVLASSALGLFPAEQAALQRRTPKRRQHSAAVRLCAHRALAELGAPCGPLLSGPTGEPVWPPGVVGSMTHCAGYRAAAVAWKREWRAIGIDAEPHRSLPPGLLESVTVASEFAQHRRLVRSVCPEPCWDRVVFCAKEAAFKLLFPDIRRVLEFHQLRIDLDERRREITAGFVDEERGTSGPAGKGMWVVENETIVVALVRAASWRPTDRDRVKVVA